ncbi:tetratricopeptide repeat protein [Yinghuangia sp. YIM S09857]|uniref:tetratricopeptide repeat protein n=1 Tax=Yinghuangia sp. YIM S09857 TaxID=3436929 RepID=UPI003F534729
MTEQATSTWAEGTNGASEPPCSTNEPTTPPTSRTAGHAQQPREPRARALRLLAATTAAATLLIGVPALLAPPDGGSGPAAPAAAVPAIPDGSAGRGSLDAVIAAAQGKLRTSPDDARTLATLGAAYVEQARVTGDPAYYPRAEEALARALALSVPGSAAHVPALVGLAALANARHDFAAAREFASRAVEAEPFDATAHGALADALTQLGAADEATAAVQRMLDLRPSVASFTRAAYDLELRGDTDGAKAALERASEIAGTPDEIAYCRRHLGELARRTGDAAGATAHFDAALLAAPGDAALRAGRAAALAALDRRDEALAEYAAATAARAVPGLLVEYGELLDRVGRPAEARAQYDLAAASFALLEANGADDDLARAQFEADHGDPAEALRRAQAQWERAPSVFAADALGWALHRNGRDVEALEYARRAVAGGWHDPLPVGHLAAIEAATGRPAGPQGDVQARGGVA